VARAGDRCDVERAGAASSGSGKAAARQGRARGPVQSGAGTAEVAHMAGQSGSCARQRNKGGGREVTKEDPGEIFRKDRDPTVMLK
jgi:hypothetical protein